MTDLMESDTQANQPALTEADVKKSWFRWHWAHIANYNYERMQATGVVWALTPVLKRLYGHDKPQMVEALQRHMQFFNTEPSFGSPILGATIAMEEQKAKGAPVTAQTIESFKTGLMGPLAGIGDTLWQGTLIPILLSITLPFASQGNILLGPVAFWVSHSAIMLALSYWLWMVGYRRGREGVQSLMQGPMLRNVMTFTQVLGAIVIGALSATYVTVKTPLVLQLGSGGSLDVQTKVLDSLMPGLIPLLITLGTFWALKRRTNPNIVLLVMIAATAVLAGFGIISAA